MTNSNGDTLINECYIVCLSVGKNFTNALISANGENEFLANLFSVPARTSRRPYFSIYKMLVSLGFYISFFLLFCSYSDSPNRKLDSLLKTVLINITD